MNTEVRDITPQVMKFPAAGAQEVLPGLSELIAAELAPKVVDIDIHAQYPKEFMKRLGALGGFASMTPVKYGGSGRGLKHAIQVIEEVSKECVSSGFLVWAQYALQWYLVNSANEGLKTGVLPRIAGGQELGGTGQSNSMKSCCGIEEARLKAAKVKGGWMVNGTLPWVSNIAVDHYFHMGASVAGETGLLIGLVKGDHPGLTLVPSPHFTGMDGTNTFACQFRDAFLPDDQVVCRPGAEFADFAARTKSAFILLQMGMGLGLIDACAAMMRRSNKTHAHVNRFLDDQVEDIEAALAEARAATYALADQIDREGSARYVRETLELRLAGGEMSLKAANAAMLHLGAKGYLQNNAAQRRLREAYFIAIVTPATKHLRKELHEMAQSPACCSA